jgi:hypothetical protein
LTDWNFDPYLPQHGEGSGARERNPRMARRLIVLIMVIVFTIGAWSVVRVASSKVSQTQSYLAGYQWCCDTHDVSGQWSVPLPTNNPAGRHGLRNESIWVGVQGPTGQFFLQAGTIDETIGTLDEFAAFWSDPEVGFHPQYLGSVSGGDRVSVRLHKVGPAWEVTLVDFTHDQHFSKDVVRLPSADDDIAQWFEEDPIDVLGHGRQIEAPFAYTTDPSFSALLVNGQLLTDDTSLSAQTFISSRHTLVYPSAFRRGSFTVLQCPERNGACAKGAGH